jgi:heme exporter protein A
MQFSCEGLAVERGGRMIFSGLNLSAGSGEFVALTGPNGSGKTSLLKALAGVLTPQSGRIELKGGRADLGVAQQLHLVGHGVAIKPALSVIENIQFWTGFLGGREGEAGLQSFGLAELAHLPAAVLSAGQQRRLSLSRLIAVSRPIWLLDEPSVGLDSRSLERLDDHMARHLNAGGIIIAATHADLSVKWTRRIDLGEGR